MNDQFFNKMFCWFIWRCASEKRASLNIKKNKGSVYTTLNTRVDRMASCESNGKDVIVVRAPFLYHIWAQVLRYCAKILASILAAVARTLRMEDIEIAASFCPLRKLPLKLPQVFIVWVYLNSRRCCCSIGRSFHHKFHHAFCCQFVAGSECFLFFCVCFSNFDDFFCSAYLFNQCSKIGKKLNRVRL